jgi:hypothetical protein
VLKDLVVLLARPRGEVAIRHSSDRVQGRGDERQQQCKTEVSHFKHRIQVAIMGVRHVFHPARRIGDAGGIMAGMPKRLVSPPNQRTARNLDIREIPDGCTARESRIAIQEIGDAVEAESGHGGKQHVANRDAP